jgi:hypothetical protein
MRRFDFLRYFSAVILAASFMLGCRAEPPPPAIQTVPRLLTKDITVLKICNFKDGHFTVDGKSSSLPLLKAALSKCSENHGVVWYYTDNVMEGEQVPQIYKDVRLAFADEVVHGGLEARLSGSPDFADVIEEQKDLRKFVDSQNKELR